MGWMGKVIGGTIGFAMGGPLGAVAGAVFGHTFDGSNKRYLPEGRRHLSDGEESQMAFFLCAFSMLAKLAQADGRVSKEEMNSIDYFMVHDLSLNNESRVVAINIFNTALQSPGTFRHLLCNFMKDFVSSPSS